MPASLEQLSPRPVFLIRYSDPFTPDQVLSIFAEIGQTAEKVQPVFVINDLTQIAMNFSDMMLGMREAALGGPGTAADPRTRHVLVGGHELIQFTSEALKQEQYGQRNVPAFSTIDEALAYIKTQ